MKPGARLPGEAVAAVNKANLGFISRPNRDARADRRLG
jgi:hypothetical protein